MTIIAACVNEHGAAIASDSLGSNSWNCSTYGSKLIQPFPNIVIGFSGSYMVERWVRRFFVDSVQRDKEDQWEDDPDSFRITIEDSWDKWRWWMKNQGHGDASSDGSFNLPGSCLLVTPKLVYALYGNGAVLVPETGYAATGSGEDVALGALTVLNEGPADVAVSAAVLSAIRHVPSCGGDVHVLIPGESNER